MNRKLLLRLYKMNVSSNEPITCQENPIVEGTEDVLLNHIINTLNPLLPGNLSIIDDNSEEQFYKFIKLSYIDRSAFSYNWPYIIQSTRKYGYCYQSENSIIYF